MSLVGFKARNHRQQVGKRGANPLVDDRATTPEVFADLHERFGFTIDVAASAENAKLPRYITIEEDGLAQSWAGERVFCNPPYSSIEPWVEKAWWAMERRLPNGSWVTPADLIVMLLPANRTEQGWWQRHIEPARRAGTLEVEFLPGRMRFIPPGADSVAPNSRPPFGCCLVIWKAPATGSHAPQPQAKLPTCHCSYDQILTADEAKQRIESCPVHGPSTREPAPGEAVG